MKIKGLIEDLKIKKIKNDNSKNISGHFSELWKSVWGQYSFR